MFSSEQIGSGKIKSLKIALEEYADECYGSIETIETDIKYFEKMINDVEKNIVALKQEKKDSNNNSYLKYIEEKIKSLQKQRNCLEFKQMNYENMSKLLDKWFPKTKNGKNLKNEMQNEIDSEISLIKLRIELIVRNMANIQNKEQWFKEEIIAKYEELRGHKEALGRCKKVKRKREEWGKGIDDNL